MSEFTSRPAPRGGRARATSSGPDEPQAPPPDTEGGPDSMLPGERSGEGAKDLFKHIERDLRRRDRGQRKPHDERKRGE